MIERIQKLHKNHSLFLFGARGVGKTTLLKALYSKRQTLWLDLLEDQTEERYRRNPRELSDQLSFKKYDLVIIDEIQKLPKLLNVVHLEIEKKQNIPFVMTGSSARKLRRGASNLLAGRAFTYYLFPFNYLELRNSFNLSSVLHFGSLPTLIDLKDDADKNAYLKSYARTYLKEEILVEQVVRKIDPFRDFLEIAAQMNGKIINYSKIGSELGVDDKTVRSYFLILEDTLLGMHLPAFCHSIRKRQRTAPKFYLFDLGIKRALDRTLSVPLKPHTYAYGDAFEHFLVLECFRLNEYFQRDYRLSYLRTKDGAEIDMIVERHGKSDVLIAMKSYKQVEKKDVKKLNNFLKDWKHKAEGYILSLDPNGKKTDGIYCLPWNQGLKQIFEVH